VRIVINIDFAAFADNDNSPKREAWRARRKWMRRHKIEIVCSIVLAAMAIGSATWFITTAAEARLLQQQELSRQKG
jgi:uncharacterized iron-regulated membrane protein